VASGSCLDLSGLPPRPRGIVTDARRAVLATVGRDGAPHAVPVCFALWRDGIVTAIDHKPKSGRPLARLANIEAGGRATFLFDRWSEDWRRLGWVMARGPARVEPPGSAARELAARYPQYGERPPQGPVIVLRPERVLWWTWD
jgi:PPOX class probable F420-dependent enzyme